MLRAKYGASLGQEWENAEAEMIVRGGGEADTDKMVAGTYIEAKEREENLKIHQENLQLLAKMSPVCVCVCMYVCTCYCVIVYMCVCVHI